jgi:hypothetical protein
MSNRQQRRELAPDAFSDAVVRAVRELVPDAFEAAEVLS